MEDLHKSPRRARFGVFEVDLLAGELRRNGLKVHLQEQPFQVLALLIGCPGEVVTREELRQRLWPADIVVEFDQNLNNAIKKLRAALGDSAENPRFVETLARRGYRFIGPVEAVDGLEESPRRNLPPSWIGAALVVAAIVVAAAYLGREHLRIRATPPAGKVRLAVLPFDNLSGDPEQEYFSDGMTEEAIAQLSRLSPTRLGVIGRISSAHYRGRRTDQIGRELGVDYVLSGSVRRDADRIRITAALVRTRDQLQLWTGTYDRELRSVLQLQAEVAGAMAAELPIESRPPRPAAPPRPVDPQAYEAYLKGRYFWNKFTVEGERKAIDFLEAATRLDPGYAPAYAWLASAHQILANMGGIGPAEMRPRARAALKQALKIDENSPDALGHLGWFNLLYEWDFPAAERAFRRALELNPSSASAHEGYSTYLSAMGRAEEALSQMRRGLEFEPLSLILNADLGFTLYYARRYDEALAQCRRSLELDARFPPSHFVLWHVYEALGRHQEGVESMLAAGTLARGDNPEWSEAMRAALARSGWEGSLRERIRWWRRLGAVKQAYSEAEAYAQLGDTDRALESLQRAVDQRIYNVVFLGVEPAFDQVRGDPRFGKILRRIGLTP